MNEMENNRLVEKIFEASNAQDLGRGVALQVKVQRFEAPGFWGGMSRNKKIYRLRILSISILATIVLTPGQGLGGGAPPGVVQPAVPAAPTLGTTTRVSVASNGSQGNGKSSWSSISAEGSYVAFESDANNLVSGDTNSVPDIFIHDRQTGNTQRVSVASDSSQGNDWSELPSISADGRYVAFESWASNLVIGDGNDEKDIFVHDRQTGITELVSVASDGSQGNNDSQNASISANGRYVAFRSGAYNLVEGKTTGTQDIFVHDRLTAITERVSVASDGRQGNDMSGYYEGISISMDGHYVAFHSLASNLVSEDTNGAGDIFVHELGYSIFLPVTQNQP